MPIYEYQCNACHHQLEALQKISDAPLQECPACGEPALKKRLSAPGFRLSGGGWYETDFKSGEGRNLKEKESQKSGSSCGSGGCGCAGE
ncbi:MAG: transcriptional regulator [Gammaproteobacteria bacterium RBG_16_57_12]|nr:MAG: transcriptional regulator [Gammaproteobacteria bacterium RBG_16_57_12]